MLATYVGDLAVSRLAGFSSPAVGLAQGQQASPWMQLFPFLVILAIFYFLLIMPAQRQRKRHQAMLGALKNGDRVITNGGIYGTVVGLRDTVVQLRISDQVRVEVARTAIASLQPSSEEMQKS
ncbi:MAG: preprotein translocase subunit YajC [Terriglobia bacterium]